MIKIIHPATKEELFESSNGLLDRNNKAIFPLQNGVYRLVSDDNYASNFGFEWHEFAKTQLDKHSGVDISEKRFFAETRWTGDMLGEHILEVGCGAGRFSQVVLEHTNATLYSVDYSSAVEVNYKNNGPHQRLKLFQASIYELPFEKASFDKVFCFGVLQHTNDFKKSLQCLVEMLKPGGELVIDFYPIKGWYSKINAKYLLRPFLKNMDHQKLLKLIRNNVDWLIKLYHINNRFGLGVLNRFVPICDIKNTLPEQLEMDDLREWVVLDTFDMFSPAYDQPQKMEVVSRWLNDFGLKSIDAQFIHYYKKISAATVKAKKES